jgi:predicted nuclease with TOPRIM domain
MIINSLGNFSVKVKSGQKMKATHGETQKITGVFEKFIQSKTFENLVKTTDQNLWKRIKQGDAFDIDFTPTSIRVHLQGKKYTLLQKDRTQDKLPLDQIHFKETGKNAYQLNPTQVAKRKYQDQIRNDVCLTIIRALNPPPSSSHILTTQPNPLLRHSEELNRVVQELEKLQGQLQQNEQAIHALNAGSNANRELITQLKGENQFLKSQIEAQNQAISQMAGQMQIVNNSAKEAQAQLTQEKKKNEALEKELEKLQTQETQKNLLEKELASLKASSQHTSEQVDGLQSKLDAANNELELLKKNIQQATLHLISPTIASTKPDVGEALIDLAAQKNQQVEKLQERIKELEEGLKTEQTGLKQHIEQLKAQLNNKQSELAVALQDKNNLQNRFTTLDEELQRSKQANSKLEQQNKNAEHRADQLNKQLQELQNRLEDSHQKQAKLEQQVSTLIPIADQNQKLYTQLTQLKEQLEKEATKNQKLEKEHLNLINVLSQQNETLNNLKQQIRDQQNRTLNLSEEKQGLIEQLKQAKLELGKLTGTLDNLQKQFDIVSRENEQLSNELILQRALATQSQQESYASQQETQALKTELEQLKSQKNDLDKRHLELLHLAKKETPAELEPINTQMMEFDNTYLIQGLKALLNDPGLIQDLEKTAIPYLTIGEAKIKDINQQGMPTFVQTELNNNKNHHIQTFITSFQKSIHSFGAIEGNTMANQKSLDEAKEAINQEIYKIQNDFFAEYGRTLQLLINQMPQQSSKSLLDASQIAIQLYNQWKNKQIAKTKESKDLALLTLRHLLDALSREKCITTRAPFEQHLKACKKNDVFKEENRQTQRQKSIQIIRQNLGVMFFAANKILGAQRAVDEKKLPLPQNYESIHTINQEMRSLCSQLTILLKP